MKLVPFFLQKQETPLLTVYRLTLFLADGGKSLWDIGTETNESVIQKEYLEDNGFISVALVQHDDIYFAKLDPERTMKSSFYTWEELQNLPDKRLDCFRTYTFCFEQPNEKLWFRSEFCDQAFAGRQDTPFAVFQGLKNSCYKKIE